MRNQRWIAALGAFVLLCSTGAALAGNPPEFENANRLYDQGKFQEAKQAYDGIVKTHNYSANLFHNLGNTEYRLTNPAGAILAYERALALDPAHAEARANLKLARNQTGAKVESPSWRDLVFPEVRENLLVIVATVGAWSAIFALGMICFRRRGQNTPFWIWAAASILLTAYAGLAVFEIEKNSTLSVVSSKLAEARLAPGEGAPALQALPAGSRVRVLSERGAWSYCALPGGGERGWILAKEIEHIRLPAS